MKRRIKYRTADNDYRFYTLHQIRQADFQQFLVEPLRCPGCGAQQWREDMVAGWRQYALPLDFEDYDIWTILAKCHECNLHYGYSCEIEPD